MKHYSTAFGDFKLHRIPDNDKNLQAWNSADTYLLNYLYDQNLSGQINFKQANILILNDDFGALTVPLAQYDCDTLSDSFVSHEAIRRNIEQNCPMNSKQVNFIKSTDGLKKVYDIVLFKTVKTQSFFKEEMQKLAKHIHAGTFFLGASMAKNLQKSTLDILNQTIGDANASLTWKKSRLIHVKPNNEPQSYTENITSYQLDKGGETLYNLANVFSRNKLDIGTRFFLEHFPSNLTPEPKNIIDLGCGNGILALKLAQYYPNSSITCVDESYMAIASAQLTIESNIDVSSRDIQYVAADGLTNFYEKDVDLIVCNPPFHQQYVVGDVIAWQMFKQSRDVLRKGGELWVVGNRHLAYHTKLKRLFGNQQLVAGNKKFVIIKAKLK